VTPVATIDRAIDIAMRPEVILTTFGDMLRVPGSRETLLDARALGADVRVIYSPVEAVLLAEGNHDRQVVFLAIGFETTVPVVALAVLEASRRQLTNFSIVGAQVRIPPAMQVILETRPRLVDAFLAPGHVCTITGTAEYTALSEKYCAPIVVTGFEPVDLLQGIYLALQQLESGRADVVIQYSRAVREHGNEPARKQMGNVFTVVDRHWRGLGQIPQSGFALNDKYALFDAERRFAPTVTTVAEPPSECGRVLTGLLNPTDCPHYGNLCDPDHPVGPPMVSSEGVCAAYYRYARQTGDSRRAGKDDSHHAS
jgi:hydrogenase expression/formation protein HypD